MAPEANGELDTFLRRAAQVAAFGAAVGAAVGAVRGAARRGKDDEAGEAVQRENGDQERAELQEQEEKEPSARESEPSEPEEVQEEPRKEPRAADEETTEDDSDEEPEEQESAPVDERVGSSDGQVNGEAAEIIKRAQRQVQQLTGHEAEGVLGLRRNDDGWTVTVEVVELSRVPSSTDVLASYDVVLDGDGELREYNRTGRYVRGRADPSEQ
jgi:outer membrane biosynthesis protein TonB